MGLVLLFYVVLLVLVPPTGEFPTTDDFDYAATAWHLADRRQLTLSDWPAMTLVTHVAWGALVCKLFGNSYAVLRCALCVLSFAAAVAIYFGFRRQGRSRPLAALAATCWAVNPLTVSLEYTFMTDVTGAALSALLIVCAPPTRRPITQHLVGYSLMGGLAYLARETACIPWIIVLMVTAWDVVQRRASWQQVVWLGLPAGLMGGAYQYWIRAFAQMPYNRSQPSLDPFALLSDPQRPIYLLTGLALALAPVGLAAWALFVRHRSPRRWLLPLAGGACGFVLVCLGINVAPPYRGELFDLGLRLPEAPTGQIPESLRGPVMKFFGREISVVRTVSTAAAWLFATAFGALLVARRGDPADNRPAATRPPPIATLTVLAMAALYLLTPGFADRYLLSLVPAALLMLAEQLPPQKESRASLCLGWAAALLVAVGSLVGVQDAMVRSRAFFSAVERLQQRGVSPFDIDAGLAFGGMHRFNPAYRGEANRGPFWNTIPPGDRSTVMASIHPLSTTLNRRYRISFDDEPEYRSIDHVPYASWYRTGEVGIFERANRD
jgi:hypothetical protein